MTSKESPYQHIAALTTPQGDSVFVKTINYSALFGAILAGIPEGKIRRFYFCTSLVDSCAVRATKEQIDKIAQELSKFFNHEHTPIMKYFLALCDMLKDPFIKGLWNKQQIFIPLSQDQAFGIIPEGSKLLRLSCEYNKQPKLIMSVKRIGGEFNEYKALENTNREIAEYFIRHEQYLTCIPKKT